MNSLENLIQYQLREGLKEDQLAEDIAVPTFTILGILKGRDPESSGVWKRLARSFHVDVNLLRFGKPGLSNSQEKGDEPTGHPQPS